MFLYYLKNGFSLRCYARLIAACRSRPHLLCLPGATRPYRSEQPTTEMTKLSQSVRDSSTRVQSARSSRSRSRSSSNVEDREARVEIRGEVVDGSGGRVQVLVIGKRTRRRPQLYGQLKSQGHGQGFSDVAAAASAGALATKRVRC